MKKEQKDPTTIRNVLVSTGQDYTQVSKSEKEKSHWTTELENLKQKETDWKCNKMWR